MPPKKEPTAEVFLTWLKEAAIRLAQTKPCPKGATRLGTFSQRCAGTCGLTRKAGMIGRRSTRKMLNQLQDRP